MPSCNGIVLNYAIVMYNKSKSKVKIVWEITNELPIPPVVSYFLCNSWYNTATSWTLLSKKLLYHWCLEDEPDTVPSGIKQKNSKFALNLQKTDADDSWQPELLHLPT